MRIIYCREGNILRDCVRPAVCDHDDDDILRENLEKRFSIDFEFTSGRR